MIQAFVDRFMAQERTIKEGFRVNQPETYCGIVDLVVNTITDPDKYDDPDPKRITVIDYGDYRGTQLYVIGAKGYQPNDYWYVTVDYGSCSGCDTLESIHSDGRYGEPVSEQQINDYWTLALHIVQNIRKMYAEKEED